MPARTDFTNLELDAKPHFVAHQLFGTADQLPEFAGP
jgi:hypothetical protein